MKLLRVPVRDLCVGIVTVQGPLRRYVTRVHRLQAGDVVRLFDPEQRLEAEGTIVLDSSSPDSIGFAVATTEPGRVVAERTVRIIQGLPKGDKLDAIVRDATELGASELWLCAAERSIVSLKEASRLKHKLDRLGRIVEEAARQSGRADVPAIGEPRSLEECVQSDTAAHKLLLTPSATQPAGPLLRELPPHDAVSFYVGPEGGFSPHEAELAAAHGAHVVHLGAFVLRTETVVAALLGALRVLE